MRLLAERVPAGSTVLVVGGEGLVRRGREGRLRRDAQRRRRAGGRRAGIRARRRLGAPGRGRVRARAARGRGRDSLDRDQHRLDDPAGAGYRAGQRHARLRRAHRRRAARDGGRQAGGADLRRGGGAFRRVSIRSSSATGSTPTSWARSAAGIPSALVLTGIDRPKHVLAAPAGSRPDVHPGRPARTVRAVPATTRASRDAVTVGDGARADRRRRRPDRRGGDRPIDLLRAGAAAIWDSGRAIFGFRVPEAPVRRSVPPSVRSVAVAWRLPTANPG